MAQKDIRFLILTRNDLAIVCWNVQIPTCPVNERPYVAYTQHDDSVVINCNSIDASTFAGCLNRWAVCDDHTLALCSKAAFV
jgi:hypothetical protein